MTRKVSTIHTALIGMLITYLFPDNSADGFKPGDPGYRHRYMNDDYASVAGRVGEIVAVYQDEEQCMRIDVLLDDGSIRQEYTRWAGTFFVIKRKQ